jgi:hypothetical protein
MKVVIIVARAIMAIAVATRTGADMVRARRAMIMTIAVSSIAPVMR